MTTSENKLNSFIDSNGEEITRFEEDMRNKTNTKMMPVLKNVMKNSFLDIKKNVYPKVDALATELTQFANRSMQ